MPVPAGRTASGPDDAAAAAEAIGWPVALKLSGPEIQHKSEIGALALGLGSTGELRAEVERMLALPEAEGAELLVEAMSPTGGVELIAAARADAVVPALVIGLGGVWTEALGDAAVIPLPALVARVEEGLRSLRGAPLLSGARGTATADIALIATVASRIGDLLIEEGLSLIEVNPLIAGPEGVVAADALIRR